MMVFPKLARFQSKKYIENNYKNLFPLYVFCHLIISTVYILINVSANFFLQNIPINILQTVAVALATLISSPFIINALENYKCKFFPKKYRFKSSIILSLFLGFIVSLFSLANLIVLPQNLQMFQFYIPIIIFLASGFFAPFFMYNIFTKKAGLLNHIKQTFKLIQRQGLNYFKNLFAFFLIGILATLIVQFPTDAIFQWATLSEGITLPMAFAIKEATKLTLSIVAIFPIYVEVKLFLSMFFMFEQENDDFAIEEYIKS